jgi:hypothetical protein
MVITNSRSKSPFTERLKKRCITLCLFVVLVGVSSVLLPVDANNAAPPRSLNEIMAEVGAIMVDLYPLIVAQRAYTKEETVQFEQSLTRLSALFKESEPLITDKPDGYQVSYEFVSEYLKVLKTLLATRHIDYARGHLYALGEVCASCHTQDTTLRTLFGSLTRADFPSDYAFAELNYITREYDEAIEYYEKFLNSPGRRTELEIIQPLQRIITIYTQVENQPDKSIDTLKKYLSHPQHTKETRAELKNWINGLEELQKSGVAKRAPLTFEALQRYVEKYLGDVDKLSLQIESNAQEEVWRVWLRGQLYHYLNTRATQAEIPMLLYWLSVIDRSIAYNFFFSLAELYLKQCVLNYPQHPYAQRCFEEFKHYIGHTYSQQGFQIPPGIQKELEQMNKALSNASS